MQNPENTKIIKYAPVSDPQSAYNYPVFHGRCVCDFPSFSSYLPSPLRCSPLRRRMGRKPAARVPFGEGSCGTEMLWIRGFDCLKDIDGEKQTGFKQCL